MSDAFTAEIVIGIDTHKYVHAAEAINTLGARLGRTTIRVNEKGYRALEAWAQSFGTIKAFGVEGTGSYGAGLIRFLCEPGHSILDVNGGAKPGQRGGVKSGQEWPGIWVA